jgi:hypothetical protein
MTDSKDKPTPPTLLPAVKPEAPEKVPDVTVPIDISRLSELLDEATPAPKDAATAENEFLETEEEEKDPGEPLASKTPWPPEEAAAEFDKEGTSDGSSIAEAIMKATGAHPAISDQTSRSDSFFAVRGGLSADSGSGAVSEGSVHELIGRAEAHEKKGELDQALELLRKAQITAPRREDIALVAQRIRAELVHQATERIGDLGSVPEVRRGETKGRSLPPRVAFLLAQIDGQRSYEQILAVSGMRRDDALCTFAKLLAYGLIADKAR